MTTKATLADDYAANGYVIVEDLVSDGELQLLRDRTEAIIEGRVDFPATSIELEPGASGIRSMATVRKLNGCAESDPVYREHAGHAGILAVVETLIGGDIKLFDSQAFLKPPGGVEKPYHQDSAYFPIEPTEMVTCWTALDDVTIENGCMWVIPGSHRLGLRSHSELWMVGERQDMRIPQSEIDGNRQAPVTMRAGSCSFHHSLLLHSSRPNNSASSRRGFAVHYMSGRSRWTDADRPPPSFATLRGREYPGCV